MPRGYGYGRGRHRGHFGANLGVPAGLEEDAVYVGPCRCGTGPHAFYRTRRGRLVSARGLGVDTIDDGASIESLREENRALSERVRQLEERLRGERG